MTAHHPTDHAPGLRPLRFNPDWITRPLFGVVLAAAVVAAIFGGTGYIAAFAALVGVGAAREWHRMVGERVYGPAFFLSSLAIVAALIAEAMWPHAAIGWAILAGGAVVVAGYAAIAKLLPAWHGAGPIYIATALLSIVMLREAPHGALIVIGLFLAVWATDTGALVIGNLVGGPKLWPALSPNKTWSGTLGAVAVAATIEAGYVAFIGGNALDAAFYGAGIAVLAHAGDLAESWVKRVFQRKDSGGMIPGHGGVLDRIDSTLIVAPVVTGLVLIAGFNPLFGVHA